MSAASARTRWNRSRLAVGLLGLQAVLLLGLGIASLLGASNLQRRAAQGFVEQQLGPVLAPALRRPLLVPEIAATARALLQRPWGLRRVVLTDTDGLLLARAGDYDGLGLSGSGPGQIIENALYALDSVRLSTLIRAPDGRVLGRAAVDVNTVAIADIHDRALAQLRITGFALLILALLAVVAAAWLLRRTTRPADWRQRADPAAPASRPESAPDLSELFFRERAGGFMDALETGIVSADRDGRVRYLNATAERLTGWPLAAARGRMAYSVVHLGDAQGAPMQSALELALEKHGEVPVQSAWLRARDGSRRPVELQACLLRDAAGAVDGAAMLCRDITRYNAELDGLKREARLSQAIVNHLEEGVLMTDASGVVRFANARATHMFGYVRDELQGFTVTKLMPVPFLNTPGVRLADYVGTVADRGAMSLPKVVGWRRDATTFPVELWVQTLNFDQSTGLVVIVRDITERLRGENLASRLGRLLDASAEEVYIFDAQNLALLEVNRGARRNLGFRAEALLRMTPLDISGDLEESVFRQYLQQLRAGEQDSVMYRCRHRRGDGSSYPVEVRLNFSRDEVPPVFMAIAVDISERLEGEARLEQLAHYDALTGLPNRVMLQDRLQQAWLAQQRGGRLLGVLFLDLDRFKDINDRHGHEVGDLVLKATAERLKSVMRESDTVARLAGDEFVILAPGLRSLEDAAQLAQKLIDRFAHPLAIPGLHIVSRLSVGVTLYPLDESDGETLLRHADMAMYDAKQAGRGCYRIFTTEIDADRRRRFDLEREIHAAVALNQFHLLMAPIVDLGGGAVRAIRACLYWEHPRFGRIDEDELLRAGARAGLIGDLELWQITHVCEHHLSARQRGLPVLPFIIEISGWQLRSGEFGRHVEELLRRYEVPGDRLILALSPDGLSETEPLHAASVGLLAQGVRLALRDFNLPLPDAGDKPLQLLLASAELLADRNGMAELLAAAAACGAALVAAPDDETALQSWQAAGGQYAIAPTAAIEAHGMIDWLVGRELRPL
ncbi:sensor domain-containing protein [Solimonas terrae]|uniref:Diguanylate cyclase n=1 Tax=Solimonas terrae TaxID=1396819 RepID=A0A6M2BT58_9GAMM|nr:diguanylate cyclase [Solimonas terrae]NGY05293.1 diguanylate cyclase [Solimonas terrae]